MTPFDIGLIALAATFALVLAGMFVPVALILCSFVGVWAIKGSAELATKLVAQAVNEAIASYFFGVVPLFVLMGHVVAESGLGDDAYAVAHACFRRVRGGLGMATVFANALFAAITGISIASAAVFARVAVPEMLRRGYSARFATGVVAGSSVLGMLIPPSLLLILYAILAEQSVGEMFVAGILPGLGLAAMFCATIVLIARCAPRSLGAMEGRGDGDATDRPKTRVPLGSGRRGARERTDAARSAGVADGRWEAEGQGADARTLSTLLARGVPIGSLIALVLGGLYAGSFTPVEAGAVGAIGAIAIGVLRGRLTARGFARALVETGIVTAAIGLLLVAAQVYARMLAFSGVPAGVATLVAEAGLGYWGFMLAYVGVLVAMGTLLDSSSIMLIVVPIVLPLVAPLGLDPVWFGIVTVVAVEIGLLTPPFGLSVYAIEAALDDATVSLHDIFVGALPFAVTMLAMVVLLIALPSLATALLGR